MFSASVKSNPTSVAPATRKFDSVAEAKQFETIV
jgi:hypothetical protein